MSTYLLEKLNYKDGQTVFVLDAPKDLKDLLESFKFYAEVRHAIEAQTNVQFILVFVLSVDSIEKKLKEVSDSLSEEDPTLWFAYPKKSSKTYQSDISRDNGWMPLGAKGFEGVRQISIDKDWSALRFRKEKFIKKMVRSSKLAMSKGGKLRTK